MLVSEAVASWKFAPGGEGVTWVMASGAQSRILGTSFAKKQKGKVPGKSSRELSETRGRGCTAPRATLKGPR